MLHVIGRRRGAGDVGDMLVDCHARIRSFSELAIAVSERTDAPADEVIGACARVERYFAEALPLHVRDEEESVLPRLVGRTSAIDAALERMHEQHEMHVELLARLLACSAALRAAPQDLAARAALLAVAQPLRAVFEPHLQAEEEILFPALRALLSLDEQQAILGELRERRSAP
ncbi:MAG TPA: hemerythrin domain-containing protein [Labilithrix sp.]|nr:hemerythrin domain-containing protein [Labilithrix sp.]